MQQRKNEMSQGQEAGNNNNNDWTNHPMEENHPAQQRQPVIEPQSVRPSLSLQATPPPPPQQLPETEFEQQQFLDQARHFFNRYKRAITAMENRRELQQLYDDTFSSWSKPGDDQNFSRVLFAMARGMKALRVTPGGKLLWNHERRNEHPHHHRDERSQPEDRFYDRFQTRDDRRQELRERERFQPRDDRNEHQRDERSQNDDDRFYDRFQTRDDRRQPLDQDRPGRERFQPRDDRPRHERERFQPRDDRQRRYHDDRQHREDRRQETNLAEIVENQQKMIETLMAKVMN